MERFWKSLLQEINSRQIWILSGTIGFEFDESPGINRLASGPIGTWSILLHICSRRDPRAESDDELHQWDWPTLLDGPMAFISEECVHPEDSEFQEARIHDSGCSNPDPTGRANF